MEEFFRFSWGILTALAVVFSTFGAGLLWVWSKGGQSAELKLQVIEAKEHAVAAQSRADHVQANFDNLLTQMHTHMINDAAAFAKIDVFMTSSSKDIVSAEDRLARSMDILAERITLMSNRLDNFLLKELKPI